MGKEAEFVAVFERLKHIMEPYARSLECTQNGPVDYSLDTHYIMPNGKPLFFGAVQIKKTYVSFYLMPVYVAPALLDAVPLELKRRMQGKSCFNFRKVDEPLFAELAELTARGFREYQARGYVEDRTKGQ